MVPVEKELLKAIHTLDKNVEARITKLEIKIDDGITGRFKDNERRITNLEANQNKVIWSIIGTVLLAVMSLILK